MFYIFPADSSDIDILPSALRFNAPQIRVTFLGCYDYIIVI